MDDGFKVFPYTTEDIVLADRLLSVGCEVLMPWGAPIGTGLGLTNIYGLRTLRAQFPDVPMVVDAGLGLPSQAADLLEGLAAVVADLAGCLEGRRGVVSAVGEVVAARDLERLVEAGPLDQLQEEARRSLGDPLVGELEVLGALERSVGPAGLHLGVEGLQAKLSGLGLPHAHLAHDPLCLLVFLHQLTL